MPDTERPQVERHHGAYLLTYPDGHTELVQTDYDYPATARALGWSMRSAEGTSCEHRGTDGTVRCPDCNKPASAFIQEAANFLDDLC